MKTRTWIGALGLMVIAGGAGCGGKQSAAIPMGGATVQVRNDNWHDMVIYIRHSTSRTRLGLVTTMSMREFRLPEALRAAGAELYLEADPIAGRDVHRSETLMLHPGQEVTWTIAATPGLSRLSVR